LAVNGVTTAKIVKKKTIAEEVTDNN